MRKVPMLIVFLLLGILLSTSSAFEVTLFGPIKYERTNGAPNKYIDTFTITGLSGYGKLIIQNGDSEKKTRVSSAQVTFNEKTTALSSNFNKNVDLIEVPVELNESNEMVVELRSQPGSYLTIQIVQDVDADAAVIIGPEGGEVVVTDHSSPIFGAKIEIPAGALTQSNVISIGVPNKKPVITSNHVLHSEYIDFNPNGLLFKIPVKIYLPYHDNDNDGYIDNTAVNENLSGIRYFNNTSGIWEEVNIDGIDPILNFVKGSTDHFSTYGVFSDKICQIEDWMGFDWRIAGDPEQQGNSFHRCENVGYDFDNETILLRHSSAIDINFSANIETIKDFGYGEFEAKIKVPKKEDIGIISAFFLYKKNNDGSVDEVDFELAPGKNALYLGTYNDWREDIHGNKWYSGHRDSAIMYVIDSWWDREHLFKVKTQVARTQLFIDDSLVWETSNENYGSPVDARQYVLFNIWSPDLSKWEVGQVSPMPSPIDMLVTYFDFKSDHDGDGFLDINDNCINNYNPEQADTNGNGIGDICDETNNDVIIELLPLPGGTESSAIGINDLGHVVGTSQASDGKRHATLWKNGQVIDLGNLGFSTFANDINNKGQIVGHFNESGGLRGAFLWENGEIAILETFGGLRTSAVSINDAGQIVGWSEHSSGSKACMWENRKIIDLNSFLPEDSGWVLLYASGINEHGQIVGTGASHWDKWHAFLLESNGQIYDIYRYASDSSGASSINDLGQVVGQFQPNYGWYDYPFIWSLNSGFVSLGMAPNISSSSTAISINNLSQVLINPSYVWDNNYQPLGEFLPENSGWSIQYINAINNDGKIVGWGYKDGKKRGFILDTLK